MDVTGFGGSYLYPAVGDEHPGTAATLHLALGSWMSAVIARLLLLPVFPVFVGLCSAFIEPISGY